MVPTARRGERPAVVTSSGTTPAPQTPEQLPSPEDQALAEGVSPRVRQLRTSYEARWKHVPTWTPRWKAPAQVHGHCIRERVEQEEVEENNERSYYETVQLPFPPTITTTVSYDATIPEVETGLVLAIQEKVKVKHENTYPSTITTKCSKWYARCKINTCSITSCTTAKQDCNIEPTSTPLHMLLPTLQMISETSLHASVEVK